MIKRFTDGNKNAEAVQLQRDPRSVLDCILLISKSNANIKRIAGITGSDASKGIYDSFLLNGYIEVVMFDGTKDHWKEGTFIVVFDDGSLILCGENDFRSIFMEIEELPIKLEFMEELIKLVAEMRSAQKDYFRTRNYDVLIRSKQLESQVDNKIHELKNKQITLFT